MGELDSQDCRLQCVEPAVRADDLVEVAFLAAVVREHAHFLREILVRSEDGSAVTVAAEGLARVEAGSGDVAEGTCLFPVLRGPEGLRGIFEEPEPVALGDLAEFPVGSALAEKVDRDDSAGLRADQGFDAFGGNLEGARVDVGENGGGPEPRDAFRRGDEGEVRNDDLVPRLDAEGGQGDGERVGPAGAGDGVCPGVSGQFRFQCGNFRSTYIYTAIEDCFLGFLEFFSVSVSLGLDVHESNHADKYRNAALLGGSGGKKCEKCS